MATISPDSLSYYYSKYYEITCFVTHHYELLAAGKQTIIEIEKSILIKNL